jgi:hypothetical protein
MKTEFSIADGIDDDKTYFQLLLALFAMGMAAANVNRKVSAEKLNDLEEFVGGISHSSLPNHIRQEIKQLKNNPPNFNTAMEYMKKLKNPDLSLFEAIISFMSENDGKVTNEGRAFLEAFKSKRAA